MGSAAGRNREHAPRGGTFPSLLPPQVYSQDRGCTMGGCKKSGIVGKYGTRCVTRGLLVVGDYWASSARPRRCCAAQSARVCVARV